MIIESIQALRKELKSKSPTSTIGLVPTMGYLHKGHISLIKRAREENDIVVLSIFVNPTQFGPNEDFQDYPRDLENDAVAAYAHGADYIFAPSVKEMYGDHYASYVNTEGIMTTKLCGHSRPIHFRGVTTVVAKLFNIVAATNAYFGMKDAQQLSVIKRLVLDLNFDVNIVACPIVRDENGLALSSRNVYLTDQERQEALILSRALRDARDLYNRRHSSALELKAFIRNTINSMPLARIDYIEIVDFETLEDIDLINKETLVALAVNFGKTRLLDNIILGGS